MEIPTQVLFHTRLFTRPATPTGTQHSRSRSPFLSLAHSACLAPSPSELHTHAPLERQPCSATVRPHGGVVRSNGEALRPRRLQCHRVILNTHTQSYIASFRAVCGPCSRSLHVAVRGLERGEETASTQHHPSGCVRLAHGRISREACCDAVNGANPQCTHLHLQRLLERRLQVVLSAEAARVATRHSRSATEWARYSRQPTDERVQSSTGWLPPPAKP
jgi:hypothetical protein